MHTLPAAFALLIAAGCSGTPDGVLSSEKMASLMADVYTGEAVIDFNPTIYNDDSTKKIVKQSVLEAHRITQADFDSSIVWYGRHIEDYIKVCDRAVEILEARYALIPDDPDGRSLMVVAGDSAQVWPGSPFYHITYSTPARYLTFNLPKDDNWTSSDRYELGFKLLNQRSLVNSFIGVEYADGGTTYVTGNTSSEGWSRINISLDSTRTANSVYGFIKLDPQPGEHIYVDSISLIRTRSHETLRTIRRHGTSFNRGLDIDTDDKL